MKKFLLLILFTITFIKAQTQYDTTFYVHAVAGKYIGTGASGLVISIPSMGVKCPLKFVLVSNVSNLEKRWRCSAHGADSSSSWYTAADATNGIIAMTDSTFTLGDLNAVNTGSALHHYFALGGQDSLIKSVEFLGNGSNPRTINFTGITSPKFIFGKSNANSRDVIWRSSTFTGDSATSNNGGVYNNAITGLGESSFTVNSNFNTSGQIMRVILVKSDSIAYKFYTGNGNDNRDISITPSYPIVFSSISHNTFPTPSAYRQNSIAADTTLRPNAAAITANLIQSLGDGTFQVGSGIYNTNTIKYYSFHFGDWIIIYLKSSNSINVTNGIAFPQYPSFINFKGE